MQLILLGTHNSENSHERLEKDNFFGLISSSFVTEVKELPRYTLARIRHKREMSLELHMPQQLQRTSSGLQRRLHRRDSICSRFVGRDDRGWTPLHIAARRGDTREVCRLLDEGVDVNEPSSGYKASGTTPLHLAATGGHLEVMDELLERGANIDARTRGGCGWTPLHNAAKEKNKKAIRFLIENGAFLPPDITDGRFNPPLHYCPGLEWAYKIKQKSMEKLSSSDKSSDEETCTESWAA